MNNVVEDAKSPAPVYDDLVSLKGALSYLQDLRESLYRQAVALSTEYAARREALGQGFCNLNVMVHRSNHGRSIGIYWGQLHFKRGRKSGFTHLPRAKNGKHFDLTAIDTNAPDWIRPLAREIEIRARPIREALIELMGIERRMRVIANRLHLGELQTIPDDALDDAIDADATPDTESTKDFQ